MTRFSEPTRDKTVESITIDEIVECLYDPFQPGGLSLSNFLDQKLRKRLLQELKGAQYYYKRAPREYGNAVQELSYFYLGEADEGRVHGHFQAIDILRSEYAHFYESVARKAFFQNASINSIAVNKFEKGSVGITPHFDESRYVNLISVFVLEGEAPFHLCSDRRRSNSVELDSSPGSLILLRAPRTDQEKKLRPMHYVGPVSRERYTVCFRSSEVALT